MVLGKSLAPIISLSVGGLQMGGISLAASGLCSRRGGGVKASTHKITLFIFQLLATLQTSSARILMVALGKELVSRKRRCRTFLRLRPEAWAPTVVCTPSWQACVCFRLRSEASVLLPVMSLQASLLVPGVSLAKLTTG